MNPPNSQILGSQSLSFPSEPPELGNWFPSYQYESPVLESIDNFQDSVSDNSETGKDDIVTDIERKEEKCIRGCEEIGKKEKVLVRLPECSSSFGDDKGENQSLSENLDSSYSPLLPSDHIDVRNWFSSYVYESPTLDTSDGFRDSVFEESKCEDGHKVELINEGKNEDYNEFRRTGNSNDVANSNGFVSSNNSSGFSKLEKQPSDKVGSNRGKENEILSGASNMCFGVALEESSNIERLQNHDISPARDVEFSNLDEEDPQCLQKPFNVLGSLCSSDRKSSRKLNGRTKNTKDSDAKPHPEANCLSPQSNQKSVLANESCNGKGDEEKEISKDGFVTTRRGRFTKANKENLVEMAKENYQGTVSLASGKGSAQKRKALADITNFDLSSVTEITGKWRCPQKRKPNLGPPLKQLRLEQWIRRV
ncbi:hypothetical protein UlMin_001562 [Ulmus minor]